MGHTVVLELSDEEYGPIEREAAASGRTPAEIIRRRLVAQSGPPKPRPVASAEEQPAAPVESSGIITYEMVQQLMAETARKMAAETGRPAEEILAEMKANMRPKPRPPLGDEEREAAWARLRRHRGALGSANPRGSNNELIDEDLAREYASTHDEEG